MLNRPSGPTLVRLLAVQTPRASFESIAPLRCWLSAEMNPFRRKSDREVVEALRRTERLRRPMGLAFIVLGLVLLAFHVWGEAWMRRKALQIADALSEAHRPLPADIRDAWVSALTTMGPLFLTSIPHPGPNRATGMICLTSSPSVQPSA